MPTPSQFKDMFKYDPKSRQAINKKIAQQIRERNIAELLFERKPEFELALNKSDLVCYKN